MVRPSGLIPTYVPWTVLPLFPWRTIPYPPKPLTARSFTVELPAVKTRPFSVPVSIDEASNSTCGPCPLGGVGPSMVSASVISGKGMPVRRPDLDRLNTTAETERDDVVVRVAVGVDDRLSQRAHARIIGVHDDRQEQAVLQALDPETAGPGRDPLLFATSARPNPCHGHPLRASGEVRTVPLEGAVRSDCWKPGEIRIQFTTKRPPVKKWMHGLFRKSRLVTIRSCPGSRSRRYNPTREHAEHERMEASGRSYSRNPVPRRDRGTLTVTGLGHPFVVGTTSRVHARNVA